MVTVIYDLENCSSRSHARFFGQGHELYMVLKRFILLFVNQFDQSDDITKLTLYMKNSNATLTHRKYKYLWKMLVQEFLMKIKNTHLGLALVYPYSYDILIERLVTHTGTESWFSQCIYAAPSQDEWTKFWSNNLLPGPSLKFGRNAKTWMKVILWSRLCFQLAMS